MRNIRRAVAVIGAALIIAVAGSAPAYAKTEHCPEPSITGHIENGSMDNDLVLPAGTVACVKGSTDAVSFIADGVTDLFTYLGNGHDVSYYVIYAYPEVTPSPSPSPSATPSASPTPTPTPTNSPEPSETPSPTPSPTGTPQPTPSASPTPVPTSSTPPTQPPAPSLTLPPTDTEAEPVGGWDVLTVEDYSGPVFWFVMFLTAVFILAAMAPQGRRR